MANNEQTTNVSLYASQNPPVQILEGPTREFSLLDSNNLNLSIKNPYVDPNQAYSHVENMLKDKKVNSEMEIEPVKVAGTENETLGLGTENYNAMINVNVSNKI